MKISIDDDLYDRIKLVHKHNTDAAIRRACETLPVQEKGRTLLLDGLALARLEEILAGGSLTSSNDLLKKVEALAHFEVGGHRVEFDASDWGRLAQRATRLGLPVATYLDLMLDRFKDEWMSIGEPTLVDSQPVPAGK